MLLLLEPWNSGLLSQKIDIAGWAAQFKDLCFWIFIIKNTIYDDSCAIYSINECHFNLIESNGSR